MTRTIGVLALQGDFLEHEEMLRRMGCEAREVRLPEHLEGTQGLIMPGGESTAIGRLMREYHLDEAITQRVQQGYPVWGTCAGLNLLARDLGPDHPWLCLMDIAAQRNAFGRQVESFEVDLPVPALGEPEFHAVFIRAPYIARVGAGVDVLARLDDGRVVAAREGHLLVTAFHPELTGDERFHRYFLGMVDESVVRCP